MTRVLIVCGLCAFATAGIAGVAFSANEDYEMREWQNASSTKKSRAALIRADAENLLLRRPDGTLATTTIAALSERDRQYVASIRLGSKISDSSSTQLDSTIEKVQDTVESIQQLPRWLGESQAGTRPVPAAIVYVRVSRNFLEDYVERTVNRRKPVRDCVLGARIVGESHTRGRTKLMLLPSNRQLLANILFEGTLSARTRGFKGPVVLHNVSETTFQARKRIKLDDAGPTISPATANSRTHLRTDSIDTYLPRLRGRFAKRIAWRRTAQSHNRAEAITAAHTEADIRDDFDERINASMKNVERVFASKIANLETGRSPMPTDVRFRCRPESIELALLREDATASERELRPPAARAGADVSVRVHRTLFTGAIEDPELLQEVAPLFIKLLDARAKQENDTNRRDTGEASVSEPRWAIDFEWLSLDFEDPGR